MPTVNIHEAKTNLSKLIEQVEHGEEVIIARSGRPVVRMVRLEPDPATPRVPGSWKGRLVIHPDFDELPSGIAAAFRGDRE